MSYETIRAAHKASGATVTKLADSTTPKIGRARLGEWLSRAKPGAKPRRSVYQPPTDDDARAVVEAALALAKENVAKLEQLAAATDPSRACAVLELRG